MNTQYQYRQIPPEGFIRIVILYPAAAFDAPIRGHLIQAPLEKSSSYCAVSYSWGMNKDGDCTANRTIYVSGREFAVTQNLFEGLRRIRDQAEARRLWIDAICINQDDIPERNSQVTQMADVYSCTEHLIIWLGEGESEDQDKAVLDMASYNGCQCKNWGQTGFDYYQVTSKPYLVDASGETVNFHEVMHVLREMDSHNSRVRRNKTIALIKNNPSIPRNIQLSVEIAVRFFKRRYWRRRWIVQELYHSRGNTREVRWGPYFYQDLWHLNGGPLLDVLCFAAGLAGSDVPELKSIHEECGGRVEEALKVRAAIDNIQKLVHAGDLKMPFLNFMYAMSAFDFMGCLDDRDRLFALSSLCPHHVMAPDYSLTISQVSIRFAKDFLRNEPTGLINLLKCLRSPEQREMRKRGDTSLPSWVPDLRNLSISLPTRSNLEVKIEVSLDASIIAFDVYDFGVVEMSTTSGDLGSEKVVQPAVKGVDEVGQVSLRPFPQECYDMGCPKEGDRVCMLLYPSKDDTRSIYGLMYATSGAEKTEAVILRKQSQTYHGGAVYQLMSYFEWRIYRPFELGAKVRVSVG